MSSIFLNKKEEQNSIWNERTTSQVFGVSKMCVTFSIRREALVFLMHLMLYKLFGGFLENVELERDKSRQVMEVNSTAS